MQNRFFISLLSIQFINFIFLYKYLDRVTEYSLLISITYVATQFFLIFPLLKLKRYNVKIQQFLILIFTLITIYLLYKVSIYSLNVDRWSVVSSFWEASFSGKYPYLAHSHLGNYPGPMPIYFILLLPFHLLGELGIVPILTVILFSYFLYKNESKLSLYLTFLLVSSCATFWEVVSRSSILFNGTLILIYLIWAEKYKPTNFKRAIILGIIGGLLLSTRNVFSICYILLAFYFLLGAKIKFSFLFVWAATVIITFALTFLPLIIFFKSEFMVMNPFLIQSSFLVPQKYVIVFLILSIFAGFICKEFDSMILLNGILLFTIASVYSIYLIVKFGFNQAYFGSEIDISYYIFSIPFFIYSLSIVDTEIFNKSNRQFS